MRINAIPKKMPAAVLAVVLALLLAGCEHHHPVYLIVLVDVSASIDPASQSAMISGVEVVLDKLQRGDSLVIVPITNDSDVDLPGHVLRFHVPTRREAFDFDLKRMRTETKQQLLEFQSNLLRQPGQSTDLLGTLKYVSAELATVPKDQRVAVVVLSDFIQDDSQFNFRVDSRLDRPEDARELAVKLSREISTPLREAEVSLGYVGSKDLRLLSHSRRHAIEAFWVEYLANEGAHPVVVPDGSDSLPSLVDSLENSSTSQ